MVQSLIYCLNSKPSSEYLNVARPEFREKAIHDVHHAQMQVLFDQLDTIAVGECSRRFREAETKYYGEMDCAGEEFYLDIEKG